MPRKRKGNPVHGWVVLDKPYGLGSTSAVAGLLFGVMSVLSACNNGQRTVPDIPVLSKAASNVSDEIAADAKLSSLETECAVVKGVEEVLSDETPPIIIIGEVHGYKGAPSLVKALLCNAAKRGLKAHLALEYSSSDEIAAQEFIKSRGSQTDYKAILSDSRWLSLSDGRHTSATFGLLEYVQALPREEKIGVSYFVPTSNEIKALNLSRDFTRNYEIALADNLKSIFKKYSPDKMFVLTGNLHAMKGEAKFGGESYLTMANYFMKNEALSLNISNALVSQFSVTITPDEEGRYDGVYNVVNDAAAPAMTSPFK